MERRSGSPGLVGWLVVVGLLAMGSAGRVAAGGQSTGSETVCPDLSPLYKNPGKGSLHDLSQSIFGMDAGCGSAMLDWLGRVPIGPSVYPRMRAVLQRAGVALPPYSGWFDPPKLKPGQLPPYRRVDPLVALSTRIRNPDDTARRVMLVSSVIAFLSKRDDLDVAAKLVDFTFRLRGFAFRSAVSRALERLGPRAVPGLLSVASRKAVDFKVDRFGYLTRKYARYMLGVIEEGDPLVALSRADSRLRAKLLEAYGRYRVADAVAAVIAHTDDDDPLVRRAARKALAAYFEGPRPRSLRRRLKLPGGRETERRQLVYMNYRQRAVYELKRELQRLTGGDFDRTRRGRDLVPLLYDAQRKYRKTMRRQAYIELSETLSHRPLADARAALDIFLAAESRPESWEGFDALVHGLALRSAAAGKAAEARRLLLVEGLLARGSHSGTALTDTAYLFGLEALARGHDAQALSWCRAALARDPKHPGCLRLVAQLGGVGPEWLQVVSFLLLVFGLIGAVIFLIVLRRSKRDRQAGKDVGVRSEPGEA